MSDDPDLYTSKISFILKSDNVEDLDLTFEEEIYDKNKVFVKVIINYWKFYTLKNNFKQKLNKDILQSCDKHFLVKIVCV